VNIINLRVLNAQGLGTDSGVIAAIDRAIQLKSTYKIRVINLSLGRSVFSSFTADPISLAVERAWKAGIVVVVAAGNLGRNGETQGYGTIASPGNSPYVITVGAVRNPAGGSDSRTDDTLTSYSSKGPTAIDQVAKPDLVAPGNLMVARTVFPSTLTTVYPANAMLMMSKQYLKLSGTSMAAPAVAGTAAMMIQKDSTLTPDQVKARLMKTAWKGYLPTASIYDSVTNTSYWVQHDLFAVGAGYLDASAALASTRKIGSTQSALSPRVVRQNGQVVMTTSYPNVTGVGVVWGTDVLWGTGVVWGTQVLQANGVVWGSGVVWGTDVASGYGVIWGTQGVTGTSNPFPMALAGNGDN
jgi:serine protease AprX